MPRAPPSSSSWLSSSSEGGRNQRG
jgi:hypothetical protein